MKRRTDSASRRSCIAVEPTRSAKTIVTILRAVAASSTERAGGATLGAAASEVPQESQNLASARHSAPHAGQRGASGFPQPSQNRAPVRFGLPQLAQFMATTRRGTSSQANNRLAM